MKQFWKTRWMNDLFTKLKGLHSHALIFLSFLIIINICKKNCEISALKMPKGRTPYKPRDLDYFVLCCTIEEIFKGMHPTQERRSLLHHVTSGVTCLPLSQSLCGKLERSKNKPNTLLLFGDKRRLKFGAILGSYFFFNCGYWPSIWLTFSDDSLKIKVYIDSCKVEQVHIYYLLRKVVCLLDWDLSNHRPLLAQSVSLESHEWVSMHQGCNVETSNSEVIEYWTILSLKIQQH